MEDRRMDSIEERTRKVEDAIIRFEYIADTILVQVENRLCALEKHDEEIQTVLYTTCDIKSKEIDEKVSISAKALKETYDKYFIWCIAISFTLFSMFVGYIAYDQGQKTDIGNDLTKSAVDARDSRTHIEVLHQSVDRMSDKLDRIVENQTVLIEKRGN